VAVSAPAPGDPVNVFVEVDVRPKGEEHLVSLEPGGPLHAGDRIAMRVRADRPAFVYVVQTDPTGSPHVLYPGDGDVEVSPESPVRLPHEGQWLEVDEGVGADNFDLLVATAPLDRTAAGLCERMGLPCAGTPGATNSADGNANVASFKAAPPPPPPPPPNLTNIDDRGGKKMRHAGLRGRTDRRGLAVVRFVFQHVK
jgi:hypothetical protein